MRRLWLLVVCFGCFTLAAACGGGGGSNVPKCTPGLAIACTGPGNCQGNQVCAANGTYGTCMCTGGTAGATGGGGRGGSGGSGGSVGTGGSATGTGGSVTGTGGVAGSAGTTGGGGTAGTGTGGSAGGGAGTGGSTGGAAGRGGSGGATGTGGASAGSGGSVGTGGRGGSAGGGAGSGGSAGGTGGTGTGGTGGSVNCDPVAQTGCSTGQRCTWIFTTTTTGHPACLADGTVNLGGACTYGAVGEATGFDNCKKGSTCINSICETDCTEMPDSCGTNYACNAYSSAPFNLDGNSGIGVCEPTCDPLTQKRDTDGAAACGSPTPATPTKGCFGQPGGKFTCAPVLSTTKTSEMPVGNPFFLNSCAPGYEPLLIDMTGSSTVICVALCKPTDTSSASTAGAAGLAGSGYTCPNKGANAPNECRYWWFFEDPAGGKTAYSNTLGFCFDYPRYKYDNTGGTVPNTTDPSCTTLSPTAHNFDLTLSDAQVWGCMAEP